MRYIYPKLSQHDWNVLRLGGPGLGNLLFTYGRAVADSKRYNIPLIWPTWRSLKVGPYLRHEMDKRNYDDLFINNVGYIDGIKKVALRLTKSTINRNEINQVEDVKNVIVEYTGMEGMFEPIIDDYTVIYEDLINNLQPQNHAALEYDFDNSISVHIRLGDFKRGTTEDLKNGSQNISTPVSWYVSMVNQIRVGLGKDVVVYVFSDGTEEELYDLLRMSNVS